MKYFMFSLLALILSAKIYASSGSLEEVRIPQENLQMMNIVAPAQTDKADLWEKFSDENGGWLIKLDKFTGSPVSAFGKAIHISGYDEINNSNIEEAAMKFLEENSATFNLNIDKIRLVNIREVNNRWYVSYKQTYKDMDVLLSEVELRIFSNGNVMAFRINTYNDINVNETPSVSINEAIDNSYNNHKQNTIGLLSKNDNLYILPVFNGAGYSYNLVYNFDLKDNQTASTYTNYADAHSGEIVWRYRTSHNSAAPLTSSGNVKLESPLSPFIDVEFPFQKVIINGDEYFTDEKGELDIELEEGDIIKSGFLGKYGRVTYQSVNPTVLVDTVKENGSYNLYWNDNNSQVYDRFGYYHVNHVRNWLKSFDPDIEAMDIVVDVVFLDDYMGFQMVNAFSTNDGDTIAFIGYRDAEARLSESSSVLYHEYGHGINTRLYKALGAEQGMTNYSLHEALADVTACLLLDDPRVGPYVFVKEPDKVIRNLENDNVYPDDIIPGDSHHNGQILAGAIWDLRNLVSLEFATKYSHFARYGTPDGPDVGNVFSKYFIELLIAVDDDGDLSNGTPYYDEILAAFNRHQIGTNLIIANNFVHTPLKNTDNFVYPFDVNFSFETKGLKGTEVDSAFVIYTINNSDEFIREKAILTSYNSFIAQIPALDKPAMIDYKFEYYTPYTEEANYFPMGETNAFNFLAGYSTLYYDNLENDEIWTMGDDGDDAKTGLFEITTPVYFALNLGGGDAVVFQPAENHSETGDKCLITGASVPGFGNPFGNSLIAGSTSAISPAYDLTNHKDVILNFYIWNKNFAFMSNHPLGTFLRVYASNDNGLSWTEIADYSPTITGEWYRKFIYLPAEFDSEVKLKFTASSSIANQVFSEILIDDVELLVPAPATSVTDNASDIISVYPNPFSGRITIESYDYEAAIYDLSGTRVYDLPKGMNNWNGTNFRGIEVESGIYILRINTGNEIITKKIIKL